LDRANPRNLWETTALKLGARFFQMYPRLAMGPWCFCTFLLISIPISDDDDDDGDDDDDDPNCTFD
jgi:hypothetical protein